MTRLFLSPPHVGEVERQLLLDAFDSNWIAPLGPHVDAFEREFAVAVSMPFATALSSGTAAIHLALNMLGVVAGADVLVPSFTFAATANAVTYVGARPVFVDSDADTWNMDPGLLDEELARRADHGDLPGAVIAVDLYGQCADYERIEAACAEYDVPLVEDAAEALGATYRGRPAGSFGDMATFSFNGNKIITTSGGGMLVSHNQEWVDRSRYLASQARDPAPHYQHSVVGYNYRLSNLLAAVGRGQLRSLPERVRQRRVINSWYREALAAIPGIEFMPAAGYGEPSWWLTCVTVDPAGFGASASDIRVRLRHRVEAGLEADASPAVVRRLSQRRGRGVCGHLRPWTVSTERVGDDRGRCRPGGRRNRVDAMAHAGSLSRRAGRHSRCHDGRSWSPLAPPSRRAEERSSPLRLLRVSAVGETVRVCEAAHHRSRGGAPWTLTCRRPTTSTAPSCRSSIPTRLRSLSDLRLWS
jgi:dTDP-4-amino-4,6-dideoxygalactose transaminase